MAIANLILFLIFLAISIKSANYAIKYSSKLARRFNLPEFIVSFFIIAIISVLPEATLSIISAFKGSPGLGLGTILGSNIADLTLVFGIAALFSNGGIRVRSKILRNNFFYLILLIFPLLLGLDGKFSRIDGGVLILLGIIFFIRIYHQSSKFSKKFKSEKRGHLIKNLILLAISLTVLILGAFLVVKYSLIFAQDIKIPEIIVGITILAFGTCIPELVFSINAVKKNHDELALGDVLGTVITDSTIVLGLIALISPFSYDVKNIYVLGGAMFIAGVFATLFMKSDKTIKKGEGVLLILGYILFVILQFLITKSYLFA